MSSVYCRFIDGQCYDYVGKCFNCKFRIEGLKKRVCENKRKQHEEK